MRSCRTCCWLAAVLLLTACGSSTPTRIVRTDGTTVVGDLVATRLDAIIVKTADGSTVSIPRATIASIESVSPSPSTLPAAASPASGVAAPDASAPQRAADGNGGGKTRDVGRSGQSGGRATRGDTSTVVPLRAESAGNAGGGAAVATIVPGGTMVIPAGTMLSVVLDEEIGSDSSDAEDAVEAELHAPLIVNGTQLLPAGARLRGTVIDAASARQAEGRGRLALRFDLLAVGDRSAPIVTAPLQWRAPGVTVTGVAKKEGSSSFFGRVVSKTKKGLRIGDGRSDGATQGSKEVRVDRGTTLKVRLEQPLLLSALAER